MHNEEPLKLLLVDDQEENLAGLKQILKSPEFNFLEAQSSDEALSLAGNQDDIALVVMDVQMPGLDGFATAKQLRHLPNMRKTPVIFISDSHERHAVELDALEWDAVDYLLRPLKPALLKCKVKMFLDLHKYKAIMESQTFELEKRMTELSTVLLYLQGKQKELKQQAAELQKVNRELRDFAYVVSHDLKAPLRAISCLANWIAADYSDKFDENGKEQLDLLLGRVRRMHDLIDGILQYSRIGRVREQSVKVDLNVLVREVVHMLAPPDHITVEIENELPAVVCEKIRLEQVFQNLISNSIKYMDKPQGKISIGCEEEDGYWKLHVTDNGPGIDAKYAEKVFQIFQTLRARDEYESTGIGLSLVKKIIENYGGKVWLKSEPGEGATFYFTLPKEDTTRATVNENDLLAQLGEPHPTN